MVTDGGISDTCYSFRHGSPNFWESPDIVLSGNKAFTGMDNTVQVTLNRASAQCQDAIDKGTGAFYVIDLYAAVPNANISVNDVTLVKPILHQPPAGGAAIAIELGKTAGSFTALPTGAAVTYNINWRIPGAPTHDAEKPGHKCLVTRVYENSASPSNSLKLMELTDGDPHYAQKNICIDTCKSPCGIDLVTSNKINEAPRQFQLRLVHNPNPSRFLMQTIERELRAADMQMGQIAQVPPKAGFELRVDDIPNIRWVRNQPTLELETPSPDLTGCPGMILRLIQQLLSRASGNRQTIARPDLAARRQLIRQQQTLPTVMLPNSVEGTIPLAPGQSSFYHFETDLEGEPPGSTHIFHVMEIESGIVQGGVTMVMVKS